MPYSLSEAQKKLRVECCQKLLLQFEKCYVRRLYEIATIDVTWIYYSQPKSKEKSKCWLHPDEPRPKKPRPDFRAKKVMYAIAFDAFGPVAQVCVPKGQNVTGNFYCTQVLTEVKKHYTESRPRTGPRGIKLLHDNASSHNTKQVAAYIEDIGMQTLNHPPYSPDLNPCDFWLFSKLKSHLSGKEFTSRMEIGFAINKYLKSIPQTEYKKTFHCWLDRLKECIRVKGDYFENI